MDEETAKKLLDVISEEDLLFLVAKASETSKKTTAINSAEGSQISITATQRFYSGNKIVGSHKRCYNCGQSMVNGEDHARALLGSDEDLFSYLESQAGLNEKTEVNE